MDASYIQIRVTDFDTTIIRTGPAPGQAYMSELMDDSPVGTLSPGRGAGT
jgi:hypothetical protein